MRAVRVTAVLVVATLAAMLANTESGAQSFSDRLFGDAFDLDLARSDSDGDGVSNRADRCHAYTLTDNAPVLQGCTPLDLVDRPFRVVDPVAAALERVRNRVQGLASNLDIDGMRDVAADIASGINTLNTTAFDVNKGSVCAAGAPVSNFGQALIPVDSALSELRQRIEEQAEALPGTRPNDDYADHTEEDLVLLNMQFAEFELSAARSQAAELSGAYDSLCAGSVVTRDLADTIEAYDPATRRILMTSGLEVALASDFAGIDDLYPDREVNLQGRMVADDMLFADSMTGVGTQFVPDPSLIPSDCIKLRVVPVQRRPPFFSGPFLHHDPAGYEHTDGHYYLEAGTGFVADTSDCPDVYGGPGSNYPRYSLKLELAYTHVQHGAMNKTLAFDLHHEYAPAYLPAGMHPSFPATLTVESRWQSCTNPGTPLPPNPDDCSEPQTQSTSTLTLEVDSRTAYCNIVYQRTVFDLEDDDMTGFRRTRVSQASLLAPFTGSVSNTFQAEGYASPEIGTSSYPFTLTISGDDYFAIHNQDFFDPDQLFSSVFHGVDSASGLTWPRLSGNNNGFPFSYSCDLPEIVRDAVKLCLDSPDSFYRLPFSGGSPTWVLGQGNNGAFTHNGNQAFAFDFGAPEGTSILAARGGTVVFVRENQTGNSFDDPNCGCNANALIIRHQDGSEALYVHMPENGVFKAVGAKVDRGDVVAKVGNTGFSTAPHLHFQEQIPDSGGMTTPSRFQAYSDEPPASLKQCWVPEVGDLLYSNNEP